MKIDLAKSGYRTFSKNISEFAKINEMPIPFDIRRLNEGDGIEAAFINQKFLILQVLCLLVESCVELHRHNFTEFRTRCLFLTDETFFKM
jgi:hypothetical protein